MLDCAGNSALLVARGNDEAQQLQRLMGSRCAGLALHARVSSQPGCASAWAAISSKIDSSGISGRHAPEIKIFILERFANDA